MITYQNAQVRRQDRLLDEQQAFGLLRNGEYGLLSMVTHNNRGYGIPLNYVWDSKDSIYFHCAIAGEKLEHLQVNNSVSFCVVGKTNVVAHKFTTGYQSIICFGRIVEVSDLNEKMNALTCLVEKYSAEFKEAGMDYAKMSFERTKILRLEVEKMSGKAKNII